MHTIKPYETRVSLFRKDGSKHVYASKSEALKALGSRFISNKVGENFRTFSHQAYFTVCSDGSNFPGREVEAVYKEHDCIMRDDDGKALTISDFQDIIRARRKSKYSHWNRYAGYCGDGSPVPGSGRSHSHRGTYYRRPNTTAERRLNQIIDFDEPRVRPSRNLRNLTNAWDDYQRADRDDKSWKRFRDSQHKSAKTNKGDFVMAL